MKEIRIKPKKLAGDIVVPPSKSLSHRAIISASLTKGESTINNVDLSDDIIATIDAMTSLGAKISVHNRTLTINGIYSDKFFKLPHEIFFDCNESGSTLRFLIPISLLFDNKKTFAGDGRLGKRPLDPYYRMFEKQKIKYSAVTDKVNLMIDGKLQSGDFEVEGDISSQFVTGLLFTLPLLDKESTIIVSGELESKNYVDLTLHVLEQFGIKIENQNYEKFVIPPNQEYKPCTFNLEGDYSQAAFFYAANFLGSDINIKGLNENTTQGDREIVSLVKILESDKKDITIDGSNCPDIIPVFTIMAALAEGKHTKIENIARLRLKESDRIEAVTEGLKTLGADIKAGDSYIEVNGVKSLRGGKVSSFKDHRIAMSFAICSIKCTEDVIITNPMCVSKSYPDFFEDLKNLGANIIE